MMFGKLLAALVVVALAQYARAADVNCDDIRVSCLQIDPKVCSARGGVFIPRGGFCGFCDICPKYVGVGQSCKDDDPYLPPTPTCKEPLICDPASKKCVAAPAGGK
ncbi:uncharacterized protein LOC124777554 [Schistocerca piceifrons]|uniref:uncharacterized protein LOC124777554 n=1 Tax=Schistocerca piceifrons TaxID=274613 RepID=UPI001F5FD983|nr:uncharacterized protein LOC124777554 [Schistocerca piceifrons]